MARVGGQWICLVSGRSLQGTPAHFGGWWLAAWAWGLQLGSEVVGYVLEHRVSGAYHSHWGLGVCCPIGGHLEGVSTLQRRGGVVVLLRSQWVSAALAEGTVEGQASFWGSVSGGLCSWSVRAGLENEVSRVLQSWLGAPGNSDH